MSRVKISYAVDFHEIPKTTGHLMDEAVHWLRDAADDLAEVDLEVEGIPAITEKVHAVREALARADQRIDDCYAITAGYHEANIPRHEPEQQASALPQQQEEQVGDISQKIKELQQAMGVGEVE